MKIKITAESKSNISKDVLTLLSGNDIEIIKVDVESGLMYVETENLDKQTQRSLASLIMQIKGVKWVESINIMPVSERSIYLTTLLNAVQDPVIGINFKGRVIYKNQKADQLFSISNMGNTSIKQIFDGENWLAKIDAAATGNLPVNVETIAGPMLLDVQAVSKKSNLTLGAVLVFHKPENVSIRKHVMQTSDMPLFDNLIAENTKIEDVISRAQYMSNNHAPLVIYGEIGVGKKTIAQAIHHHGARKNRLFSSVNCATAKPANIEKEIFGFSNPITGRAGLLEISDGGTVYIENIHEMPENCQKRLLEFIQTGEFNRINGATTRKAKIKLVSSSPYPLKKYVKKNQFNSDLFYAIDITQLSIPPLRERKEDIEPLIAYFLDMFHSQGGNVINEISNGALNKIKSYYWPGNLAQLKEVIFKATIKTEDDTIDTKDVVIDGHAQIEGSLENRNLPQAVAEFEKHFLRHWYQSYPSTRKLARQLGVSHTTIAQKLNRYEIR